MEVLQFILDILFTNIITGDVDFAIAPWVIPLATTAISQGINYLGQNKERKRAKGLRDTRERQSNQALSKFQEMIGGIESRAEDIETDASPEQLYGDMIQLFGDRTQADADSATQNVFRSLMASGGDVSGQGATTVQSLREGGQRSIGDIIARFTEMTDRKNMQQKGRQDQMFGTALGHRGNIFSALSGMATDAQGRVDRRSTADRQFLFDSLGMGLQTYGTLANQTPKPTTT